MLFPPQNLLLYINKIARTLKTWRDQRRTPCLYHRVVYTPGEEDARSRAARNREGEVVAVLAQALGMVGRSRVEAPRLVHDIPRGNDSSQHRRS